MTLSVISHQAGPVTSLLPPHSHGSGPIEYFDFQLGPSMVATHSFSNAPALDVLFVPGGMGNVALAQNNDTSVEDFIVKRFDQLQYLCGICTGAVSLAKAGVLEGKKATTSKAGWGRVTREGTGITWVPQARWVEDGKVWTSSGIAAGLDFTYAFTKKLYGTQWPDYVMNAIEYMPHTNASSDPFATVHEVSILSIPLRLDPPSPRCKRGRLTGAL